METVAYPAHWEADVVLRDGGTAHLRPIRPTDAPAVRRFHDHQSAESVYLRFFAPMPHLSERDLHRFTHVDHTDRVAFVATVGDEIVGIARYDRLSPATAEVAFNISDAHQGRGLGSVLLEHLAAAARERGVRSFVADVLPQNRKMITVFRDAGFEVRHRYEDGVINLTFEITPTEVSDAVREAREQRAEGRSVQRVLNPASVVVVGAGQSPGGVGHLVLAHLLKAGYAGQLYAVRSRAGEVLGGPAFARVTDLPEPVDLAVIAVPAEPAQGIEQVVRDCAAAGVRALVVVSSGFAETGPDGVIRQRELVQLARANGMRIVGPSSFGVINTDPAVRLNASLAPEPPPPGRFSLFTQSGALAVSVLASASRRGLGVASFISAGNRADVSGNDCLQYWEHDPATAVIGLYLESIGNPRKFSRLARRVARRKPVLVVRSGMTRYGVPPGHAVRATRAPREALDSMLRQAGVIRVENLHQLFDTAQLLVHQPLPDGDGVAVVANSQSLAALAADACLSWGLRVVREPAAVPSDAGATAFRSALAEAFDDDAVHAVVAVFLPPLRTRTEEVAAALAEVAAASGRPCVTCFVGVSGVSEQLSARPPGQDVARTVPAYPTPEDAVRALAAATRYAQWRRRDPGHRLDVTGLDVAGAAALTRGWLASAGAQAPLVLTPDQAAQLLSCYGLQVWPALAAPDVDAAVTAARSLGFPVALKSTAEHLRHRADLGGVRLDISTEAELVADFEQMSTRLATLGGAQLVVQKMAPAGAGCMIRSTEDLLFGPIVSFGLSGDASELLGDVAHRIPPLTDLDVADLIRSVRAAPRLFGHKGLPALDVPALEDVVGRVSRLADDLPEVVECELNPVLVGEHGVAVLDARVVLAPPPARADAGWRVLPG